MDEDEETYCDECAAYGCPGHEVCELCDGDECDGCDCPDSTCPGPVAHYTGTNA
ncbi:hypothetical protein [Streptomyces sp. NPDC051561]|uniref:hypothetical protein n=1 Tax=Streptomyces sp. NPDC051561 TaxID=3365658 RepID=UPI00379DD47C